MPWEAGKGREQTTVCSILLPNSLNSQQGERGFSRDKEISGEELSFCPLRNQSIWTKILWKPLYHCLCFSCVRDWLYEGVHKSICLTQLLNSSTDKNKWGTEIPTQGVTLMHRLRNNKHLIPFGKNTRGSSSLMKHFQNCSAKSCQEVGVVPLKTCNKKTHPHPLSSIT